MNEKTSGDTARTVVLVNDDTTQLNILTALIRQVGWRTHSFERAAEAIAFLSVNGPVDLIVTDLYMPEIDGWRFCRILRSPDYPALNRIPILVVSATFAGDSAERITVEVGADAFMPQPVDAAEFIRNARSLIAGIPTRHRLRALIVEDSLSVNDFLRSAFEYHRYDVTAVETVEVAAAALLAGSWDVVVIDYHLPDGTGESLLPLAVSEGRNCIAVMITADPRPELALRWMKRGAAAALRKPFDPEYLIELCIKARRERSLLRIKDLLEIRTRELMAQTRLTEQVVEATPNILVMKDSQGLYRVVNQAFCRFLGKEREAVLGRSDHDLFPPSDAAAYEHEEKEIMARGEHLSEERRLHGASGYRWFFVNKTPLRTASGLADGVLVSATNIEAVKAAEAERRRYETRLREIEKAESLACMAGAIAHKFNNHLAAVVGNLELAQEDLADGAAGSEKIDAALKAARSAGITSGNLLRYVGQSYAARSEIDLGPVCAATFRAFCAEFDAVRFVTDTIGARLFVHVDPAHLRQALRHLLTNAVEALDGAEELVRLGVRSIEGEPVSGKHIFPPGYVKNAGRYAVIEVSDTGVGIEADAINRICDPFYSTKSIGRGLGMSVVAGFVRAHEGYITLESHPGRGSTFRLCLPTVGAVARPSPLAPCPDSGVRKSQLSHSGPRKLQLSHSGSRQGPSCETVLIVDDDPSVLKFLEVRLRRLGYAVVVADGGVKASALFGAEPNRFRCAFIDLTMPGLDGWETLAELRAVRRDLPVVLMSGYDQAQAMRKDATEQPDAFLRKPFFADELKRAMDQALGDR